MTYLTFWFLFGFVLSAIFGVLATDLRRDEVLIENFKRAWRFWEFRQKLLAVVAGLWLALLVWAFTSVHMPDMVIGSVIGGAAAPWVWLHFARDFVANQERGDAERETLIKTLAHKIWLEQGNPEGRAEENYFQAKEQINAVEQDLIDASAKSGEQHLARYRLLSILLGIALLVATLIPILKDWLPRAQQFQAFGISLSLLAAQPSSQSPRLNLQPNAAQSGDRDRLSAATSFAYHIGAGPSPAAILDGIGLDLNNFRHLSIFDQDRAYIAWLTYELPGKGVLERPIRRLVGSDVPRADNLTLAEYVNGAEDLLKTGYSPPRWVDIERDQEFVFYSTLVSTCFRRYIKDINSDPQLFMVATADSLRTLLQQTKIVDIGFENALSKTLESRETSKICTDQIAKLAPDWGPYYDPSRGQSPYPSLITALYLAAIGAVDSGVQVLEDWITDFNEQHHDQLVPDSNPQLGWYLWRAKWGASALPYNYHGFVVPHRQLVTWQFDESNQLGRMLGVGGSDGWMRLCRRLLPSTLHANVGQQLAFRYALERFYLFENLLPEDFQKDSGLNLGSVKDYLREAEAIRDNRGCLERVKTYLDSDKQYTGYFRLYTAQLRFNLLASENKTDRCKSPLIETIGQELDQADQFGTPMIERTLLPSSDIWEPHRVRLRLLREQIEDTKRDCST